MSTGPWRQYSRYDLDASYGFIFNADGGFQAYAIPIKLKYECPAPSKFGKDLPLWKTATTSFLRIVKECGPQLKELAGGARSVYALNSSS